MQVAHLTLVAHGHDAFAPCARAAAGVAATAIAIGGQHTCAIVTGGGVKCWGNNDYGQLGTGTKTTEKQPTDAAVVAGWSTRFFHPAFQSPGRRERPGPERVSDAWAWPPTRVEGVRASQARMPVCLCMCVCVRDGHLPMDTA
jgi:hypothetical protein